MYPAYVAIIQYHYPHLERSRVKGMTSSLSAHYRFTSVSLDVEVRWWCTTLVLVV